MDEYKPRSFKFSLKGFGVKKIIETLKSSKGNKIIVVVGIIGIALIGLSSVLPKKEKSGSESTSSESNQSDYIDEYIKTLEKQLVEIVSKVEGAGETQVMITLESGIRYVYADERRISNDSQEGGNSFSQKDSSENSVVIIDTGDGKKGLLITEVQPQVKGVVVVCEGGDNEQVKEQITELLATLLNLSTRRVAVAKHKS